MTEQLAESDPIFVGVDWAPDGWLAIGLGTEGESCVTVHEEFSELWSTYQTAERILIDVPIGLPNSEVPTRQCDTLARDVIGPRSSSVFPAPTRPALGHDDHAKASEANRDEIGKGLSIQTYNILEGIETVDEFLQNNPEARENVREAHPEVCFRALAGEALEHSKTTASGYAERLSAFETVQKNVATEVHRLAATVPDADIGVDDLLDAVALAFSAQAGMDSLHTLPPQPPTDTVGLPMEMVYRAPEPLVE